MPFPQHDGQYAGPPADDGSAIDELERLRERGAMFAVIAWPAFWWLEHYPAFRQHLAAHYRCVRHDERIVAFDLGSSPAA